MISMRLYIQDFCYLLNRNMIEINKNRAAFIIQEEILNVCIVCGGQKALNLKIRI